MISDEVQVVVKGSPSQGASQLAGARSDGLASTAPNPAWLQIRSNLVVPKRPLFPRSGVETGSLSGLERIFDPAVSTCVWRRPPGPALQSYLAGVSLPPARERMNVVESSAPDLSSILCDFAEGPGRRALEDDMLILLDLFAILADAHRIGIRLAITRSATCPRFHVDRVGLRMICTWQGPGTEWLEHGDVDRRYLGVGVQAPDGGGAGLLLPGAVVHRMRAFDVGIFKGEDWPGNLGRGAVHRSPACDPGGPVRVMATFDDLD